jgi:hypothetical protein
MPIFVAFTVLVLYAHRQGVPLPHGDARPLWRRQEINASLMGSPPFLNTVAPKRCGFVA